VTYVQVRLAIKGALQTRAANNRRNTVQRNDNKFTNNKINVFNTFQPYVAAMVASPLRTFHAPQ